MFWSNDRGTVIGTNLRVVGNVRADGLVKVYGRIEGELDCRLLDVSRSAEVIGPVTAEKVTIDGRVEGPIVASIVLLKSHAQVVGDIHYEFLSLESGAVLEGRSAKIHGPNGSEQQHEHVMEALH